MRSLERNKRTIWFSNANGVTQDPDTGNDIYGYTEPKQSKVNIGAPTGYASGTENGVWLSYNYVIVVSHEEFAKLNLVEGKSRIWFHDVPNNARDNFDLTVDLIADSLNEVRIGLKRR
jgi:hypothetical protein